MKPTRLATLLLFLCSTPLAAQTLEENTTTTVTLNVVSSCRITSTQDIRFGSYDPLGQHAVQRSLANGSISVICTRGTNNVRVSLFQGSNADASSTCEEPKRAMAGPNGARLMYGIYQNPARTIPWGCSDSNMVMLPLFDGALRPVSLTTYGALPPAQDIPQGQYADTVEVSVIF